MTRMCAAELDMLKHLSHPNGLNLSASWRLFDEIARLRKVIIDAWDAPGEDATTAALQAEARAIREEQG